MKYVYLVSDEIHGLYCICEKKEKATETVNNIAFNIYEIPKNTEPDYDNDDVYGYEGASSWRRVEVV